MVIIVPLQNNSNRPRRVTPSNPTYEVSQKKKKQKNVHWMKYTRDPCEEKRKRLDAVDASIEWIMLHTPKPQKTVIDRKTFAMRLECQLGAAHGPGNDMIGKKTIFAVI